MFGFKKIAIVATTLAALAVPSLALADDYDHRDNRGNNDRAIAQLRFEIQRDKVELDRDLRAHRYAAARQEKREIERREAQLRELLRRHRDNDDGGGWRR